MVYVVTVPIHFMKRNKIVLDEQLTIDFERSRNEWRRLNAVRRWIADLRWQDRFAENVNKRRRARLGRLGSDGHIAPRFDKLAEAVYTKST